MLKIGLVLNPMQLRHLRRKSHLKTTISETISRWEHKFDAVNLPDPTSSIKLILAHVLKLKCINDLQWKLFDVVPNFNLKQINALCEARLERKPLQFILGEWEFRSIALKMQPPVFIPRPETEQIIDILHEHVKEDSTVLEVGCGTGAISLSLLQEIPQLQCIAIDCSQEAVELTKENASLLKLSDRLKVFKCSLDNNGELSEPLVKKAFDIIVSNPPYLGAADFVNMQPELLHEDYRAFDGGKDGMSVITALLKFSNRHLLPGGRLIMEVDSKQPTAIIKHLENHNQLCLTFEKVFKDVMGVNRFISVLKPS